MRVFIALLLGKPYENTIDDLIEEFRASGIDGRFLDKDLLHLTLYYIGQVEDSHIENLKTCLKQVKHQPFSLKTGYISVFKKHKARKILYLSVYKSRELSDLYFKVIHALKAFDISIDPQNFTPHITLGRHVLMDVNDLKSYHMPSMDIPIDGFHIMESKQVQGRLFYTSIFKVKFK